MPEPIAEPLEDKPWSLYPSGSELGRIQVTKDVVARIAQHAIAQMDGVQLASSKNLADWLQDRLPSKEPRDPVKGIHLDTSESGRYVMTLNVRMAFGEPMRELAERLQRHIKEVVERMAGFELEGVDVNIVDIFMQEAKEEEPEPAEVEED